MLYARLIVMRLLKAVVVLFLIVIFNFFLIQMAPGDPAAILAGEAGATDEEFLRQLRERFGLDQPIYVQLWRYVSGIAMLDFGWSYRQGMPVLDLILARLPATLLLTGTAFVLSLALGIVAGSMAAARVKKPSGSIIMALALLFYATPLFWVALMAVVLFSVFLGWLPAYGMYTVGAGHTGFALVLDVAKHLILPATTLALFFMAIYTRMTRASMLEASQQDYVKTARAKGLAPGVIQRRHILRNALLPIITLAGLQAGQMVGGAILTETVFAWPGIGRLMFEALQQRDYNLLLGIFFFSAALVIVFNIITDLVYRLADPRIKEAS
ncbi:MULTISPECIES: ABC transporter permease [Halomonadaceae]|jgi:peptide/nickel transport system permease protein|uniref:ABC transporter permease n=2 Tax=Billgrantia TaxID=3137761 RepID=A0AAW4YRG2_9GAMM|nr:MULTISPECIES: ABC transporter permease [Halomonas]MCE8012591.1 ABC transporter permease [Halomonas desiderata]MCE8024604.1 ABC transporter permease [Halomonas aerodenitrificans]MCE8027359.1 ABC transporter permease [Halomonas desiderata]MCE8038242.1 ABC transporter permease [Halomonas sp. MCCC 1A11062]MCE8041031.1 ABC transporter permease [Halomonas desiderata]